MSQGNSSQGSTSPLGSPEERIEITIRSVMQGVQQLKLAVPSDIAVRDLKTAICEKNDISVDKQTLMYKQTELKDDDKTLREYGITKNCELVLNVKMSAGLTRRATSTDVVLYVPATLPGNNMDQLRTMIRGMSNKGKQSRRMVNRPNPELAKSSIWTPEKQMEHELTRNRMKALVKKRKKTTILSSEAITPTDGGSIIGSAAQSPGPSEPSTPPEFACSSMSSMSSASVKSSSSASLAAMEKPVTEKELKLFYPTAENENQLKMMRRDLYSPPQNEKELEALRAKFDRLAKTRCRVCRRKLALREQVQLCQCSQVFCMKHRAPESHNCTIDYKNTGRTKLMKENPKIDGGGARKAKLSQS